LLCFAILWQSNNIWDTFLKGLLAGIGCSAGISSLTKKTRLQALKSLKSGNLQIVLQDGIYFTKNKTKQNKTKQNRQDQI